MKTCPSPSQLFIRRNCDDIYLSVVRDRNFIERNGRRKWNETEERAVSNLERKLGYSVSFLSIQLFHGFHFPSIQPRLENISDNHVRCAIVSRGEKVSPREENSSIVSFHFFFFLLFFGQSRRSAASTRFAASGRSSVARVGARLTFGWSRTRNEKPTSAGCRGRRSPTDIPRDVPRRLEAGAPASCSRTRAIERACS